MIQLLSTKYQWLIAYCFFIVFGMVSTIPVYGRSSKSEYPTGYSGTSYPVESRMFNTAQPGMFNSPPAIEYPEDKPRETVTQEKADNDFIGGPSQPEMNRFKSAGADNLVNLFTGDFNYNIPLMDVGGYPINIFYDAGITPEQEASWVGLGWNINPGTVSRNMRGVPDDFDGTDELKTTQMMKPNITWGGRLSGDIEVVGIKDLGPFNALGFSLGASSNNYLGPAMELGVKGGISFDVGNAVLGSKNARLLPVSLGAGVNANLSSRGGLTISPNMSLSASKDIGDLTKLNGIIGASTSYNSRTGIANLNLNAQFSLSRAEALWKCDQKAGVEFLSGIQKSSISPHMLSSSISFAKPSYSPSIRMPITNEAFSGRFQVGGGLWGFYTSGEVEVYRQTATVEEKDRLQVKPMVGYLYSEKGNSNPNTLLDFTRFNDKEVTPNTTVISVPQYTYDVFSINGEGTGGSIRLYRNDYGAVRDNYTTSRTKSFAAGGDVGIPGHFGANVNFIKTPSVVGEWNEGNKLRASIPFTESLGEKEAVYFRNPGESSVLDNNQFDKIGGTDLVRFKLGGSPSNPTIEPVLERFSPDHTQLSNVDMIATPTSASRKKRTQVVSYLTALEASKVGLNRTIRTYNAAEPLTAERTLKFREISRISEIRKPHHISEIDVTEANGMRYIYDLPVYNISQTDFTFTVKTTDPDADLVTLDSDNELTPSSQYLNAGSKKDGYLQVNQTPAYAHSFLLGGLLSPDYVDVTNDGITEDDLGTAVRFNYTRIEKPDNSVLPNTWRTPLGNQLNIASFNPGNRTEDKDDKGNISYGERENWYVHSIESKTLIALFSLEDRKDAKGPIDKKGGISSNNVAKRLKRIDLYNKADLRNNGLTGSKPARPIKSVFFEYSYQLCKNSSDNNGTPEYRTINGVQTDVNANKGRLTLDKIYFTYNGQERAKKSQYKFAYENSTVTNPDYTMNSSDRWGDYKPKTLNPGGLRNADYPYSFQPQSQEDLNTSKKNAGAWNLKKILLPSGGQIEVDYESDDYAFVQDRRAAVMLNVAGFGSSSSAFGNTLYTVAGNRIDENSYVLINVPKQCLNATQVFEMYLRGQEQFAFRLAVQMPKGGYEYLTSYAMIDKGPGENYGVYGQPSERKIWIKLKMIENHLSPLSVTALEYLKEQLPGQAFPGYDVSDGTTLEKFGKMISAMITNLSKPFADPVTAMKLERKARYVDLTKCFVRLNEPSGHKYGGGHRVKQVVLKDNWHAMTNQFTSMYGSVYDYTTTETFNGSSRVISSGVASYEPSIGGEENPFQTMEQIIDRLPLGPASYGAIEMPVLDAFFPAPVVGYSKVTVTSLKKGSISADKKSRSGVGRQVSEFYTAKDFPVKYQHTSLTPSSDLQLHQNSFGDFFWKWAVDFRSVSQGFLVTVNDMHGKVKSQSSYAENDPTQLISYTEHFYRNTGTKSMAEEKFNFVSGIDGKVEEGNMGIDIELMTDTREFSVKTTSQEIQAQLDHFLTPIPGLAWMPFIWPVNAKSENIYRAVTCTKYVSYHSVVDRVVVIDKGSQVETQNLVYDAETGDVIVNKTNNEFNEAIYSTKYPAYWAYRGMGLAYKNIGAVYKGVSFSDGKINLTETGIFESGDELYVSDGVKPDNNCDIRIESQNVDRVWVYDRNKNTVDDEPYSTSVAVRDLIFLDPKGKPYTKKNVNIRIIRSGKRNLLQSALQTVTSMSSPVKAGFLKIDQTSLALNASAIEYKEKWQTDGDVIQLAKTMLVDCEFQEVPACDGDHLEKNINPYVKGLFGNYRPYRSMVFYGDRTESNATAATNIYRNGYLKEYANYWNFIPLTPSGVKLMPNISENRWVWNTMSTRFNSKGLEVETKDALGIYTAAQYGYDKSVATAIASNARYNEMFFEGFEDNGYNARVNANGSLQCDNYRHINFGATGVVNTEALGFTAHSGKYALSVGASSSRILNIPVNTNIPGAYSAELTSQTPQHLTNIGANIDNITSSGLPPGILEESYEITDVNTGLQISTPTMTVLGSESSFVCGSTPINVFNASASFTITESHYFEIPEQGNYYLTIGVNQRTASYNRPVATSSVVTTGPGSFTVTGMWRSQSTVCDPLETFLREELVTSDLMITDENGHLVNAIVSGVTVMNSSNAAVIQLCLPRGIYKVNSTNTASYILENLVGNPQGFKQFPTERFTVKLAKVATPSTYFPIYMTSSASPSCTYTVPMSSNASMLNPVFTPAPDKKMVFSAWVKESCVAPCNLTTYSQNKVKVQFAGGSGQDVEMSPAGPIIEGWQRYEFYFTPPAGATAITLSLINNSSSAIYFDDIRIHPYNSNMQSYVYDPVNLRLTAQLDANNYATFFEYDEEGGLIRKKVETKEGVKTIAESRGAKQKTITEFQQ